VLVGFDLARQLLRRARRRRWAHAFVRFLRVLRLGLVDARYVGQRAVTVELLDDAADLAHRLGTPRLTESVRM
jgi:hypothetical protein